MNTKKEILLGTIISYLSVLIQIVSTLVITPFLIKHIGDTEYGIYKIVVSLTAYISIMNFGLGNSLIRFLSELMTHGKKEKAAELTKVLFLINLFAVFLAILAGIAIYYYIPSVFSASLTETDFIVAQRIFMVLLASALLTILNDIQVSYIYVHERFIFAKIIDVSKYFVRMVLLICIISFFNAAVYVAVVDLLISLGIYLANSWYCRNKLNYHPLQARINLKQADKKFYLNVAKYSALFFVNLVIEQLIWNTDTIIIGMKIDATEVAIFGAGTTISAAYYSMTLIINNMLFPGIVKTLSQRRDGTFYTDIMVKTGRVQAFISMYILGGYLLFGQMFVCDIWLSPAYQPAWTTSLIIMFGTLFSSLISSGHLILRAIDKQGFFLTIYLLVFLINTVCTYYIVDYFGIVGAACATSISYIVGMCMLIIPYYKKVIGINIARFLWNVLSIVIVYSILGGAAFFSIHSVLPSTISGLLACVLVYSLLFAAVAYFVLLKRSEKDVIKNILLKRKHS